MTEKFSTLDLRALAWYSAFFLLLTLWCVGLGSLIGRQDLIPWLVALQIIAVYIAWSRYVFCRKQKVQYSRVLTMVGHVHFIAGLLGAFGMLLHATILYATYGGYVRWVPVSVLILGLLLSIPVALGPRRLTNWAAFAISGGLAFVFPAMLDAVRADQEAFVFWTLRPALCVSMALLFLYVREVLPTTRVMRVIFVVSACIATVLLGRMLIILKPSDTGQKIGTVPIPHAETLFWSHDGSRLFCGGADFLGEHYVLYEFSTTGSTNGSDSRLLGIHRFKARGGVATISHDDRSLAISLERSVEDRLNSLVLYKPESGKSETVYIYRGNLHFPFISNVDPWSISDRYVLFTSNFFSEIECLVHDRETGETTKIGEGAGWRRSFWMPGSEERVCFPADLSGRSAGTVDSRGLLSCSPDGSDVKMELTFDPSSVSYYYYQQQEKLLVKGDHYYLCDLKTGSSAPLLIRWLKFLETAWAPDGRKMATLNEQRTQVIISENQVPSVSVAFTSPGLAIDSLAWSRDPSLLLFHIKQESAWVRSHSIMEVNPQTLDVKRIASSAMQGRDSFLRGNRDFFVLSPDGQRFAFVRRSPKGGLVLYLIDLRSSV